MGLKMETLRLVLIIIFLAFVGGFSGLVIFKIADLASNGHIYRSKYYDCRIELDFLKSDVN